MINSNRHLNPTICILDSGVGGLTIYREVEKLLPQASYLYACDHDFLPYGEKSAKTLTQRLIKICTALEQQFPIDLLVLACNSASTSCLAALRKTLKIPVVGVVPAIKPASISSKNKVIGLLATHTTINSPYTEQLIRDFGEKCSFIKVGAPALVEQAERLFQGNKINEELIKKIVEPFRGNLQPDTIVLACTHFPHLLSSLQQQLPKSIAWLDSGRPIANRVKYLVENLALKSKNRKQFHLAVFTCEDTMKKQCKRTWLDVFKGNEFHLIKNI